MRCGDPGAVADRDEVEKAAVHDSELPEPVQTSDTNDDACVPST
jgi:hypothetical protein